MKRLAGYFLLFIVSTAAIGAGAWGFVHSRKAKLQDLSQYNSFAKTSEPRVDPDLWTRSLEKVKEDRGEAGNVALEIPPEVRHYTERRWFLAAQVAEVKRLNLQPCQDFVDLAAMIVRGELVPLPAVTENYILFGVGARVDGGEFTRYVANQNLELNDEAGLRDAYVRIEATHVRLQKEISALRAQLTALKKSAPAKEDELPEEIATREQ
jgi:hypothetical protein